MAITTLLCLVIPLCAPPLAQERDLADICDEIVPALLKKERVPGFALALIRKGQPVTERFYGRSVKGDPAPPGPETAFGVASVSKMFTAWGVMRLVEQGELVLDDPVQPLLKRWKLPPSKYKEELVTLRHLLTHTAGYDMSGKWHYRVDRSIPELVDSLNGKVGSPLRPRLMHAPGSRFRYSGVNYAVVQMLVEDVTGRPFMDFMRETVLQPLDLGHTDFDFTRDIAGRVADSHDPRNRRCKHHRDIAPAAGSIHTTLRDLEHFVSCWFEGPDGEPPGRGIVSPESWALMTTSASNGGYGIGHQIMPIWPGLTIVGSSGGTRGWTCNVYAIRETGNALIALTNSTSGGPVLDAVHEAWIVDQCAAFKETWEPTQATEFSARYLGRWKGAIEGAGDGTRTIPLAFTLEEQKGLVIGRLTEFDKQTSKPLSILQLDGKGFRAAIDGVAVSYFDGRAAGDKLVGTYYHNGKMTFHLSRVGD